MNRQHGWFPAALALACLLLTPVLSLAQDGEAADCTGTFSNLYYHLEAGDLLGEEIKIVMGRSPDDGRSQPLRGWFQAAIGAPFDPVEVDVRCHVPGVEFVLPDSCPTPGTFRGTITDKGIQGILTSPRGVARKIDLPRRASYWDEPVFR